MHYSTEISTKLAWESYKIFQNFTDVVGAGSVAFVKTGFLVISPENEIPGLEKNTAIQKSIGIPTSIITLQEARELVPDFVLNEGEAFCWEPESGHADPSGTAMAYANRARELGADIVLESQANDVEIDNGKVVAVITAKERYETPVAVLATGPWSGGFLDKLGIDLPLEATRHEVFLIRRPTNIIQTHPGGADLSNLTYFRPEGSNLTLVGNGNVEHEVNPDTYNTKPTMNYVEDIWTRLAKRIPAMANAEFFTGYAGLYTSTPDMHPIVDKVQGIDGLYVCTGFSGHGFKLSPTVGICVSELIIDGAAHTVDLTPLRMSRFNDGDLNPITYGFRVIA